MIQIPPNATILHESEGLTIHENENNKFTIVTLFYYADPAKRSEAWMKTAQAGMSPAKWAKEYEIDYLAQFGERAFPEISDRREHIVVPAQEFDQSGIFWAGFDYGERNPSAFTVYTYRDGCFYAIWELYEPCKSIPEFAHQMRECLYYDRLKYIAADPTIFDKRTHNSDGVADSVANLFIKQGIKKFIAGNQDEQTWIALMRQHWGKSDPTFKICENCVNLIKEFEEMTFDDYNTERMRQENNFREGLKDKNNHALDANKYFFNSQPTVPKNRGSKKTESVVDKWYGWGERTKRKGVPPIYQTYKLPSNSRFKEIM